jgi:hypothetical protein
MRRVLTPVIASRIGRLRTAQLKRDHRGWQPSWALGGGRKWRRHRGAIATGLRQQRANFDGIDGALAYTSLADQAGSPIT